MTQLIDAFVSGAIDYLHIYGMPFGFFLIVLESIIPALPLGVFVAFNMMAFGTMKGFIVSWIGTIIGCILSYLFFNRVIGKWLKNKLQKKEKYNKLISRISSIRFTTLVLVISLPFSPAFAINIAAGIAKMDFKKFVIALLIGKISIIYFWGYIGKSLLESVTDLNTFITVIIMLLFSYVISKLLNKKFKIE